MAALPWEKMEEASYQWLFSEPGGPYRRSRRPHMSMALIASSLLMADSRFAVSQVPPMAWSIPANMEVAAARLPRLTMPKPGWLSSDMTLPFRALAAASISSRVVGTFTLYFWKTSFRYISET